MRRRDATVFTAVLFTGLALTGAVGAQGVDVKTVLGYTPIQKDVDIETPTGADVAKCKLEVERQGKGSGWVLSGPQGQVLRRFMDTDGDQHVDEYRYFQHGLEVYRDLDTNGDNEVDQFRWLNMSGTRWGIDRNQDGRIDEWKVISPEEVAREAVLALIERDERRLSALVVSAEDLNTIGISDVIARQILSRVSKVSDAIKSIASSKIVTPRSKWIGNSSSLMPNMIPAETGKTNRDIVVYENVMAAVETGGETGFVQIGELVQVGQAWKLAQLPKPLEGNELAESGILLQPFATIAPGGAEGLSPEMRQLIEQLRTVDESAPQASATREEIIRYNVARAGLLDKLATTAPTTDEKLLWMRQRLEGIAAATQMDTFPNGLNELRRAEVELSRSKQNQDLLAFASFQRLLSEYNINLQKADTAQRAKIQESWLASLKTFVSRFAASPESADAMLQLAITHEFNGDASEAQQWYERLAKSHSGTQAGIRAQGALRRLGLKGQRLQLAGRSLTGQGIDLASYQGKVVAVIFWATWCKPCTEDLPQIQELYRAHRKDGFEVVGVNLDSPGAPIQDYVRNFKVTWPHIHEDGGLESRPAVEFGVISLPTMFLIDKKGTVVSSSASVDDLKNLVPALTKR